MWYFLEDGKRLEGESESVSALPTTSIRLYELEIQSLEISCFLKLWTKMEL